MAATPAEADIEEDRTMLPDTQTPHLESGVAEPKRAKWLAGWSLALAVFIEVLPTEASIASILRSVNLFWLWLTTKLLLFAIILSPLTVYVVINGPKGLRCVWRQAIATIAIVVIHLGLDIMFWSGFLGKG